jgi:hypothetical protein
MVGCLSEDDKRYLAFINISGASREVELVSISGTSYAVNQVVHNRQGCIS